MIAVMVEAERDAGPERRYFAVARPDRNRAEWAAIDCALALGGVAASPRGGDEPVEAVAPLTTATLKAQGLSDGQIRALGPRWPRRWLAR